MSDLGVYTCVLPDCARLVHGDPGIRELFAMDPNAPSGHPKIPSVYLTWLSLRTSTARLINSLAVAGLLFDFAKRSSACGWEKLMDGLTWRFPLPCSLTV